MVRRYLSRRVDPNHAEDLIQETLTRALKNLPRFEYRREKAFDAWIVGIAKLCLKEHWKRSSAHRDRFASAGGDRELTGRSRVAALPDAGPTPSVAAAQLERSDRLYAAIAELPEDVGQLVILTYIEELERDEVAKLMGVDPGQSFRKKLFRARRALRDRLEELEG